MRIRLGKVVFDGFPSKVRLRELGAFATAERIPEGTLTEFSNHLQHVLFHASPLPKCNTTHIADDYTTVVKIVWSDDLIRSALVAAQRHCFLISGHIDKLPQYLLPDCSPVA